MKISCSEYSDTKYRLGLLDLLASVGQVQGLSSETKQRLHSSRTDRSKKRNYFSARSFNAFNVLNGASTTNLLATIEGTLPPGSVCTW